MTVEDALQGACDILAEQFADEPTIREQIRKITWQDGVIRTTVKDATQDEKKRF